MVRAIIILASAALLTSALDTAAAGATQVVTTQPTLANMSPGQSVLYDDKRCPAGMIAKFTKAQKRSELKRNCIHH
ncbi:hypothetical protein A6U87_19875 [Rhizobium sp. AC44/96]|uniref:DUF6719 family protein n=1 Tax=unclassified Rhizobium TaxID=2613769 RepID=UPI00080F8646|nr:MULTISPECIES: DUF6719 family protein [unclassified Rhizobium]MDM9620765.1 hypothetical protein [Rhizobium sp. S96]OCJ02637.1 hypothetical protein A6U87_19875 [Rhizobium sp. AC44/96]